MTRKRKKSPGRDASGERAAHSETLDMSLVLKAFREAGKPLSLREAERELNIHKKERRKLEDILDNLVELGKLIRIQGAFGLTDSMNLIAGRLEIMRSGVGFVIPEDKRRKDLFINPRDLGDAWHGDRVVAAITRVRKNKSNEGRIARIVERGTKRMPCRVVKTFAQDICLCQPTDPRHKISLMADSDELPEKPGAGDILIIEPGDKLDHQLYNGRAVELLGSEDNVASQERMVKLSHDIPREFPQAVLDEAENLPSEPGETDFAGRTDLRHLDFVTIDGAKARDFDDAVYVEKIAKGYRLWVAIADVSHYVPQGSALDREAIVRANSYYFPQSVEPMFPERLSNGLCSLNPNVPRLAVVAQMDFSAKGLPKAAKFYPAVIQSKARLTYSAVNRALLLKDEAERENVKEVLPLLELAETLARQIKARRTERGGLDFDLPEPEIHFGLYGETLDIRPKVRHFGHQIVEEFMIAANEAVATYLTEQGTPLLYRIHPEPDPDKLKTLFGILSRTDLALNIPPEPTAETLQKMLALAEGTDLEFLVNRLTLRTMMQAKYSPRHEPHFGLASPCYCHFTSPIRRYADLVVHRALKLTLQGKGAQAANFGKLATLGDALSAQERVAMEAEREILKRITVLFLRDKIGTRFTGVVNSLADFGFWVELHEVMAEGMIRLSSLTDDYYTFIPERQELLGERTGRRFHLGQKISVELVEASLSRLEVNLKLLDEDGQANARPERPAREKKPKRRRG